MTPPRRQVKMAHRETSSDLIIPRDPDVLAPLAHEAAAILKALGHEGRLMILCHLATGEKSVTELESLLESRQAAVSQQLARLRMEGLVEARRDGKTIHYSLSGERAEQLVAAVYDMFTPH